MSISRLEQQLHDAREDAEHYKLERDYFKGVVFQQPHPERHYGRPQSPRLRRVSVAPSLAPSSATPGSDGSYGDYEEEIQEEERNVRRRTSNYHPVSGPPPNDTIASVPPPPQGFSTPAFPPVNLPPVHNALRNHQYSPHTGNFPVLQQPPSERVFNRDAFASDSTRYESPTWTSGQGQPRPH